MDEAEKMAARLEQLQHRISLDGTMSFGPSTLINPNGPEAAALIRSQANRIEKLEKALKSVCEIARWLSDDTPDDAKVDFTDNVTVGDLRRAKSALESK